MKRKLNYLLIAIFVCVFSVYYISVEKQAKATKGIEIIGEIHGVFTIDPNGGGYCAPANDYCASIITDGYKCWVLPNFKSNQGNFPTRIEVSYSDIEDIRNGAIFCYPQ